MYRTVLLLASLLLITANCELLAGDQCTHTDGRPGTCQLVTKCTAAEDEIKAGINPTVCSLNGADSVVCCPQPRTRETRDTGLGLNKEEKPGVTATKMCKEYSKITEKSDRCFVHDDHLSFGKEVKAMPKEFPHMALIGYLRREEISWLCFGSLISPRFVLTVAQCLSTRHFGNPRWVRVGDLHINATSDEVQPQEVAVEASFVHPDFRPPGIYNDIGLLKLQKNLDLNEFVRPACLHTNFEIGDTHGIVTGWGPLSFSFRGLRDDLTKVRIPIQSTEFCVSTYKSSSGTTSLKNGISGDSMLCAGDSEAEENTCVDLAGSPIQLVMKEPSCMYDIVGMSSFGRICGTGNSPTVYTRVSHYISWIENIVWP